MFGTHNMGMYTNDYPIVVEYYKDGYAYYHKIGEVKQHKVVLYTDSFGQLHFKYKGNFIYCRILYSAGMIGGSGGSTNHYELWVKNGAQLVSVDTGKTVPLDPRLHCMQFNH